MKKFLLLVGGALCLYGQAALAQRKCGADIVHRTLIAKDPSWEQKMKDQVAALQSDADNYLAELNSGNLSKTTATSAIPVIFHIVVDSNQFNAMGGTAGIIKRVDSQIVVLERDFNKKNLDSTLIPTGWKSLFGNPGIHFGLARLDPNGHCTPGYEIKIVPIPAGFSNMNQYFPEAKTAGTGLPAWDVNKYYNVWCINFSGAASSLLGITLPKIYASGSTVNQIGVCITYNTLGKAVTGAGSFPSTYNQGRTLTHETGHFFEIWHPWGDDGPTNISFPGYCPWASSGGAACTGTGLGSDDGITDTPPQSQETGGNPTYTIAGGTINDCCQMNGTVPQQPKGIACLSYMDYTDDNAMHMFTTMQAAAMASKVIPATSTYYSLTQNPSLLTCPVSVTEVQKNGGFTLYPNPTTGEVSISLDATNEQLNEILVYNVMGQQVMMVKGQNKDYYSIDLSGMSKGIYFVKCNFASGSITRKILLQ